MAGAALTAALMPVVAVAVILFGSPANERTAIGFFINVVLVVGLQMFTGNSGITSFGQPAFMGIAAYTLGILATPATIKGQTIPNAPLGLAEVEIPFFGAALVAVLVTALVALVAGLAITRQADTPAAIATVALLIVFHTVVINWLSLTRGPRAFYGIPIRTTIPLAMTCAVVAILAARLFRDSAAGVQLRASRDDALAAAAVGVRVRLLRVIAWTASAVVTAIGGILLAAHSGTLSVSGFFYFPAVFIVLAMLLFGGMGSVSGAVVGAIAITLGNETMRYLQNGPEIAGFTLPRIFGLPALFLGTVIVLVMKFRPDGLLGDREFDELIRDARAQRRFETAA